MALHFISATTNLTFDKQVSSSIMSTYTTVDIRKMIDDLDDILRAGIDAGNIKDVFSRERGNFVSNLFGSVHRYSKDIELHM